MSSLFGYVESDTSSDTSSDFSTSRNRNKGIMGWFRRLRDIDREEVSETIWKWRCKILPNQTAAAVEKPIDLESTESEDGKVPVPGKDPMFGSDVQTKTLFEGKNSDGCHFDWVDYPPKQMSKAASRAQDRVAIKVYKIKDRSKPCIQGRYPLKFHKIEIQSPILVSAMEPIVKKENVNLDVNETAEFAYPFRPLWFCQEDFYELWKNKPDGDQVKAYLQLLLKLMDEMFAEMRVKRRHLKASGLVDFRSAWTLFPRGATVYSEGLNSEFLAKVDTTSYIVEGNTTYLVVKCQTIAFSGELFLWKDKTLVITQYEGNKIVKELAVYPIEFHSEPQVIEKRLIARGKKVLDLQGLEYRCYNALALHRSQEKDCYEKHNVEGRILIDVVGYNKYHLAMGSREKKSESDKARRSRRKVDGPPEDDETAGLKPLRRRLNEKEKEENRLELMARESDFKYMSELIGGYSLKSKIWGK